MGSVEAKLQSWKAGGGVQLQGGEGGKGHCQKIQERGEVRIRIQDHPNFQNPLFLCLTLSFFYQTGAIETTAVLSASNSGQARSRRGGGA